MENTFSKSQLISRLKDSFESHPEILAAWLGGSTATGFEDEWSDTDVVFIGKDPSLIFSELEKVLREFGSFSHVWRVEETAWKNFYQKFYVFNEGPETYFVDAGVFTSLDPQDYREWFNFERHGKPVILFDKNRILDEASKTPRLETPKKTDWPQLLGRFEIIYRTFIKESRREKLIDAFAFYQRLLQIWVQFQRINKTPQKQDFGLRYIYRDLPSEDAKLIETYIQAADLNSMKEKAADMRQRLYRIYQEIEGKGV